MLNASDVSDATPPEDSTEKRSWVVARGLVPDKGPRRTLALASFVNMIGNGMYMTGAALFFTRSVGLPVAQVGIGLGIAALVGLLAGVPIGHVADRRGPRETYLITLSIQAVVMAALVLVQSFWLFLILVCLTQLSNSASMASRGPLIRRFAAPHVTKFRSYLRASNNLAGSMGAAAAGIAVQLDTDTAYTVLILGNSLTFVASALVIRRLPSLPPLPKPPMTARWIALKDHPYITVTLLDGIMSIQGQVLLFALPLWIFLHSDAPRWLIGASAVINTLMVVVLQVRASRGVDTNVAATKAMRRASLAFLAGMALIAATGELSPWLAAVLIVGGVVMHTIGELWHSAASFELSFGLAPAHAQGQYSGLYGLGQGLSNAAAPPLLALLCITWGAPGWLVMGGIFVVVGLTIPYAVRWAERTRPEAIEATA